MTPCRRWAEGIPSRSAATAAKCSNGCGRRILSRTAAMATAPPCGLIAVYMDEARALARVCAQVTHDHPQGVKGAEAVAAAVFLAKGGKTKAEIKKYMMDHFYDVDFSLDAVRDAAAPDHSCQGTVQRAIAAFLASDSFVDAIRKAVSLGGDRVGTATVTGAVARVYYAVQTGNYAGWAEDQFDPAMLAIKKQAQRILPEECVKIADAFHHICRSRAGTCSRAGLCTPVMSDDEMKAFLQADPGQHESVSGQHESVPEQHEKTERKAYGGKAYSLAYLKSRENCVMQSRPGGRTARFDVSAKKVAYADPAG